MVQDDSRLIRRHISNVISNSHTAIKGCWIVMFTAGTVTALSAANTTLRCAGYFLGVDNNLCQYHHNPVTELTLVAVYFLTFARFYLGDIRVFDRRYSEIFHVVNESIDHDPSGDALSRFEMLIRVSDYGILKVEVIWLLFQTLLVVFIAYQVDRVYNFVMSYILLLLLNSAWLAIINIFSETYNGKIIDEIFPFYSTPSTQGKSLRRIASWKWVFNNIFHASLLVTCLTIGEIRHAKFFGMCGALICLSNCLIDFALTLDFYFPKFGDVYSRFLSTKSGGSLHS